MLGCEREVPPTNLYQDVLNAVSNSLNIFQVNGSGSTLNAVSGSENVREQVGLLIGGWVSLQRKKAFVQCAQMFFKFRLKGDHQLF
jgi:hypothetical protein